jgi:phosphopantothenoylcysteine synthetase/decarboxylase
VHTVFFVSVGFGFGLSLSFFISHIDSSDEWRQWKTLGDPIMHIDLRNWADLLLVAPLSAHSLAKFRYGMCDDILSSVVRAWDYTSKPLLLAPAMNTAMWDHVVTQEQLSTIQQFAPRTHPENVIIIDQMTKTLACGDVGKGALAPVDEIMTVFCTTLSRIIAARG